MREFLNGYNEVLLLFIYFFYKYKATEVEEVSQLGCMGSGNKLQKQKKGPGSSGESKAERRHLGKERGAPERLGRRAGAGR